ncbi:hypothetical protein AWC31_14340 [Mycolicibacterium wolinskyi]|uniref:Ig-like domain-containing protein n=1 Tax=Mycolicibacterium wolinskyi TaxID=59750 RepID=A0A1X2FJH8_9MYCO|nr:hypothetical protein AWC31_14340 [Mycolicibacterium wolinskyi]
MALDLSTGQNYSVGADVANPTIVLPEPLHWDSQNPPAVTLTQTMPACERYGLPTTANVGPPEAGAPTVYGLCKGNPKITVAGLNDRGLVTVRVFLNGAEFRTFTTLGESVHSCDVEPPLDVGSVYAIQEICGQSSPQSAAVTINEHPAVTLTPRLIGPLYSCARSVKVADVHVGAEVRLFIRSVSTGWTNEVKRQTFLASVGNIDVDPVLKQDDEVWVQAVGCGSAPESPHEKVKAHPPIDAPKFPEPVENESTSVLIEGAIPTADVYIYVALTRDAVAWELAGAKKSADGGIEHVALNRMLKTGQLVAAAQYFCEVDSGRGQPVEVVKQRPLPPKLLTPADGAKNVPTNTTFTWSDPGAQTERKADTFDIAVSQGSSQVAAATWLASTTYTIAAGKLTVGQSAHWSVQGRNSTGVGGQSHATFTTLAPKPILSDFDQDKLKLKGSNFPPSTVFKLKFQYVVEQDLFWTEVRISTDDRKGDVAGKWMSDAAGNFDATVDLYALTPVLVCPINDSSTTGGTHNSAIIKGPVQGEKVILRAEYYTFGLGWISSDPLTFHWNKKTMGA